MNFKDDEELLPTAKVVLRRPSQSETKNSRVSGKALPKNG
jgi:hypothetical protein